MTSPSNGIGQPGGATGDEAVRAERQRLKGATVSGAAVNMTAQLVRFGLQFAYQIVIARLLLPGDFGLVALSGPAIAFVQIFSDLGLSSATIQHPNISQGQLSFLFWLNVAMGVVLAIVTACVAPLVGWFYGDPRVVGPTIVFGGMLLVGGFYSQHMALLNRNLRFIAIACVELASFVVGAAAGIISAVLGMGYWAIVNNVVATSLTAIVLAWTVSGWKPGRPGPISEMKTLFAFGGNLTGFNFVNFFARNSDNILIGRFCGEESLGLYDRAYKLVLLPFNQIAYPFSRVALPLLSKTQQEPEFYRRAYQSLLEAVLLLTYPGLIFALVTNKQLILLLLGPKWAGISPIFAVLVLDAFVAPIGGSMGWLFVSQGRTREMRNWGIASSLLFVACFAVGLHWGPTGVAGGYVTAGIIEICVLWRVARRTGPLQGQSFLALIHPYLISGAVTLGLLYALTTALTPGWTTLILSALAAHILFIVTMAALPQGRRCLRDVWAQLRRLLAVKQLRLLTK